MRSTPRSTPESDLCSGCGSDNTAASRTASAACVGEELLGLSEATSGALVSGEETVTRRRLGVAFSFISVGVVVYRRPEIERSFPQELRISLHRREQLGRVVSFSLHQLDEW